MKDKKMAKVDTQFGNISKQNKLMKLAENIKEKKKTFTGEKIGGRRRKKSDVKTSEMFQADFAYTPSIEHLVYGVYRPKPSTPPMSPNVPEPPPPPLPDESPPRRESCLTSRSEEQKSVDVYECADRIDQSIADALDVKICPSPSIEVIDHGDIQHPDGNTIYANMPALQKIPSSNIPVIKNLSLANVENLPASRIERKHPKRSSGTNLSQQKGAKSRQKLLNSTRSASNVPVVSRNPNFDSSFRRSDANNHRSSSCGGSRNSQSTRIRCVGATSSDRWVQRGTPSSCKDENRRRKSCADAPFKFSSKVPNVGACTDRPNFARKYSSSNQTTNCQQSLRSSGGEIERRISAFKKSRAKSETTLTVPRTRSASMIPVPVHSLANGSRPVSKCKYDKIVRQISCDNIPRTTGSDGCEINLNRPCLVDRATSKPNDEWENEDEVQRAEKAKTACENIDLLVRSLPDASSLNESMVSGECLSRKKILTTSKSATGMDAIVGGCEPETLSRTKSEAGVGNSSFYRPHPSEETESIPFATRFSSLRFHAEQQPTGSILQKFRKTFSLRNYSKNRQLEFCKNEIAFESSHPATVSGISPKTQRKMEQLSVGSKDHSTSLRQIPISRTASVDKKKHASKKDIRGSKCSSTDSGIQLELAVAATPMTPAITFQQATPPVNNSSSENVPKVVLRRPKSSGRRLRRPFSDLGGSLEDPLLIFAASKIGLIVGRPRRSVRRTQSDLSRKQYLEKYGPPYENVNGREDENDDSGHQNPIVMPRRSNSQPLVSHLIIQSPQKNDAKDGLNVSHGCRPKSNSISLSNNHLFSPGYNYDNEVFTLHADDDQIFHSYTYAEAVWDHVTMDAEELAFKAGDVVQVIDSSSKDWWWGRMSNKTGWFPASFVWLRVNQDKLPDGGSFQTVGSPKQVSSPKASSLSGNAIRTNIINEIVSSEKDYVNHLQDVCDGYLSQVRKRPDMFTDGQISSIFGNLREIYIFQRRFLAELKECIDSQAPHKSQIGRCFLRNRKYFQIYSDYCNNHPLAVGLLQDLYENPKYIQFFEACRLLQGMIDISLDGFLLNPVQKICKYPLQLAELLKYTDANHPDYDTIKQAQEAMKNVAHLINERKRRMECLEKLINWQQDIVDWQGADLIANSSELIYAGEVSKLTTWSREVSLFLFDHQLIYCKRDLLKRNIYIYKGRIDLDSSEIHSIPDCKDSHFGAPVKNAWKVHCKNKNKSYVFHNRTAEEKSRWLGAFVKERQLVQDDIDQGFKITNEARRQAFSAAEKSRLSKRPKGKTTKNQGYMTGPLTKQSARTILNNNIPLECGIKSRTGSLPHGVTYSISEDLAKKKAPQSTNSWFSFGSTKKSKR